MSKKYVEKASVPKLKLITLRIYNNDLNVTLTLVRVVRAGLGLTGLTLLP